MSGATPPPSVRPGSASLCRSTASLPQASLPPYTSAFAMSMMSPAIRYCRESSTADPGCARWSRVKSDSAIPRRAAARSATSGGSWFGSPTRQKARPQSSGPRTAGSEICVLSSTITRSKAPASSTIRRMSGVTAP